MNPELKRLAQSYADEFNEFDPDEVVEALAEVSVETAYWDERTNLFSLAASNPLDHALVLAAPPGGEDYLVVRWLGRWVVDDTPVDWAALEAEAFDEE